MMPEQMEETWFLSTVWRNHVPTEFPSLTTIPSKFYQDVWCEKQNDQDELSAGEKVRYVWPFWPGKQMWENDRQKLYMLCMQCLVQKHTPVAVWPTGSALVLIDKVHLRRARLVLRWVTVSGFDSWRRHFISVHNQPPRSTQPSTFREMVNQYQPKGGDALRPGSKGRYGLFAGKTVCYHISAL